MKVERTAIPDVLVLEPKVFGDQRGFFMESYNRRALEDEAPPRPRGRLGPTRYAEPITPRG